MKRNNNQNFLHNNKIIVFFFLATVLVLLSQCSVLQDNGSDTTQEDQLISELPGDIILSIDSPVPVDVTTIGLSSW